MSSEDELQAIQARVVRASGDRWEPGQSSDGVAVVRIRWGDGRDEEMRVTRDGLPVDRGDVEFIACARSDLEMLLAVLRGERVLSADEAEEIEARLARASPGPWRAFVSEEGGLGGSDVISVSDEDNQPDLYLWLGGQLAPGADFKLVAAARQDIPNLLATAAGRAR